MDSRQLLKGFAGLTLCPLCAAPGFGQAHWSYPDQGTWGGICSSGAAQSPIDIVATSQAALPPLDIAWSRAPANIENNGHTIQVNFKPGGTLTVGSNRYSPLNQFHFHHPSEHLIGGKEFPMEVHFVHNYPTRVAVIGVLMTAGRRTPPSPGSWRRCRRRITRVKVSRGSIRSPCYRRAAATTAVGTPTLRVETRANAVDSIGVCGSL
jgi:carbonic anhydrase